MTLETDMLLRVVSHPPLATKGAALTHPELDGNLIALYDAIKAMNSGSGIAPYDGGKTYTGVAYVSYNGNIYKHISGTPTTGIDPDSDPAKWELTSIGELSHVAGTDQYLDFGGDYQVSAQQISLLLTESYNFVTKTKFAQLVNGSDLRRGAMYVISNYGAGIQLVVIAGSYDTVHPSGILFTVCPDVDIVSNWSQSLSYVGNELVQWDGKVWKNLGGFTGFSPPDDPTNWEEVFYPDAGTAYKGFSCIVASQLSGGSVAVQSVLDQNYNEWDYSTFINKQHKLDIGGGSIRNKCSSATIIGACNLYQFSNNIFENSMLIAEEGGDGIFTNNHLTNVSLTALTFINGTIDGCKLTNCNLSFTGGLNNGAFFGGVTIIGQNQNWEVRNNVNVLSGFVNSESSNIADVIIDAPSSTTLDFSTNGIADIYGIFICDYVPSDNIRRIINSSPHIKKFIVRPALGRIIVFKSVDVASVVNDGEIISDIAYTGQTVDLFGDNGDYAELTRVELVGSLPAFHIEYFVNG